MFKFYISYIGVGVKVFSGWLIYIGCSMTLIFGCILVFIWFVVYVGSIWVYHDVFVGRVVGCYLFLCQG